MIALIKNMIHSLLITLIIVGSVMAKTPIHLNNQTDGVNKNTNDLTIENVIVKMIDYYGNDLRRTHHALKVHDFARTIGKLESLTDVEQLTLEVAAILHDIGIPESELKYNSSAAKYQELEGPPVARELLKNITLDPNVLDRICFMIGNHHTYEKVDKKDFQILFEADFLVNMYESKVKKERIATIQKKRFKTKSGKEIINSMMKE
jgi:HD superfamily phosphohydrolase YqeK